MTSNIEPVAKAELRIRKPIAEVFEAFVDPDKITKFWFDRSTGRLEAGKTVQWHWDSCEMSTPVRVIAVEEPTRILVEWDAGSNDATTIEWTFTSESDNETYVSIANSGFKGDEEKRIATALDSAGGFNLVIAAAKAFLEHGIDLKIVEDRFRKDQ